MGFEIEKFAAFKRKREKRETTGGIKVLNHEKSEHLEKKKIIMDTIKQR